MNRCKKTAIALVLVVTASLNVGTAAAHAAGRAATDDAVRSAGLQPSCSASFAERSAWATRVGSGMPANPKNPAEPVQVYFTYLQLCGTERIVVDGKSFKAPKSAGKALPASVDYGVTVVPIPDESTDGRAGGVRARAARNHGSCWVYSNAPTWVSAGSRISYSGGISCTGSVPVKVDLALLRKYNSTGTVVVWSTYGTQSDNDGVLLVTDQVDCKPTSTWATRTYGQRYHAPNWDGSYAFSSYVAACPN